MVPMLPPHIKTTISSGTNIVPIDLRGLKHGSELISFDLRSQKQEPTDSSFYFRGLSNGCLNSPTWHPRTRRRGSTVVPRDVVVVVTIVAGCRCCLCCRRFIETLSDCCHYDSCCRCRRGCRRRLSRLFTAWFHVIFMWQFIDVLPVVFLLLQFVYLRRPYYEVSLDWHVLTMYIRDLSKRMSVQSHGSRISFN
jgi:hypothetical protein